MKEKILQITPAAGLRARHEYEDEKWTCPIVCFALVEPDRVGRYVVPMELHQDGTIEIAEDDDSFVGVGV